jgi:hypothetical protein
MGRRIRSLNNLPSSVPSRDVEQGGCARASRRLGHPKPARSIYVVFTWWSGPPRFLKVPVILAEPMLSCMC